MLGYQIKVDNVSGPLLYLTQCGNEFVPDFWHHEAMLHHQRVADGGHHGENLLAG